jgi:hypothetical protein
MSLEILDFQAPIKKDGAFILTCNNVSKEVLAQKVADFFSSEGYKLEGGLPSSGVYGKGSTFWRILFGAFVKRYKFAVQIESKADGQMQLLLTKEMSGISGGIWGYSQMNNEHQRLANLMRNI